MTSIVKELRQNGGWAVITRSIMEDNKYIYRGVVMSSEDPSVVPDASSLEEVVYECECRLRDLNKS